MKKVISEGEAVQISNKIRREGKTIVVVGGCFDIVHPGHLIFLKKAKLKGEALFLLLESDSSVRKRKGRKRPVNNQEKRAKFLDNLPYVDYIVSLAKVKSNADYDKIMRELRPNVLATTYKDPNVSHKRRQAKMIGAKLKYVTRRIKDYSTTKILEKKDL